MKFQNKDPSLRALLEDLAPYKTGCATCGQFVEPDDFKDALSEKEYTISGMCQECQDSVFGGPDE